MTKLYNLQETLTILLLDELVKERDYIEWEKTNAEGKIAKGGWREGHSVSWPDEFNNYFDDEKFGDLTNGDLDIIGEIKGISDLRENHEAIAESLLIEFYRQQLYIFNFYINNFKCCLDRKQYNDLTPIFGEPLPDHPLLPKGIEDDQDDLYDWTQRLHEAKNKAFAEVDEAISDYISEVRTDFSDGQQFEMDQIWLNKVK
jgi:hypothetical protein